MPSIDELNRKFAIQDIARIEAGAGRLPRVTITAPSAEGQMYLHGAHVTHFQPRGQKPLLFLSAKSAFEDGKPIRGGVPVIFPWFGPSEAQPNHMHGFVRTRSWSLDAVERIGEGVRVVMSTQSDDQTRALWPNDFELRHIVTFGPALEMVLEVRNTSGKAFKFEEALHSYFPLGDVRRASVEGLGGVEFIDKVQGSGRFKQQEPILKMTGQTDRVYVNTTATCVIDDAAGGRKVRIAKEHSNSTVVWNPWDERIKQMGDLDPADWTRYMCIETCNVRDGALELAAGATHRMTATVSIA